MVTRKAFYEVILDKMDLLIPQVLASKSAEDNLILLGDILIESRLATMDAKYIHIKLIEMRGKLASRGNTASAYRYLLKIAKQIDSTYCW